jgi:hypothetical protein
MKNAIALLILVLAGLAGYTWVTLHWTYSAGERAGYVQKFSRKGWLCKTWEGEMALVSMPGTVAEKFYFTVRDDDVARRINESVGRRVTLHYRQHIGVPTSCFGETQYFVGDVRVVGEAEFTPGLPAFGEPGPPAPVAPGTR